MNKWGTTAAGATRWFCPQCKISRTRKRTDNRERTRLFLFGAWLLSKTTLREQASRSGVSIQTLITWFRPFWKYPPTPRHDSSVRVLVLDATSVQARTCMLLIAGDNDRLKPVSWFTAVQESYQSWSVFLIRLHAEELQPVFVVCDRQRGLLKAIHEVWPHAQVQRCLVHVTRQARAWLTQHPKTNAGRELLALVQQLSNIRTRRQKRRWIRSFKRWNAQHTLFLKERSHGVGRRWWYTHRKLRAVRSLVSNAVPDLFRFVTDPTVPRTSNHVEGGINARLKELFRCHRGFTVTKKLALASWYLALRQGQKTTRKFN